MPPPAATVLFLVLTAAAFSPVARNGYVWDDAAISENMLLRDAAGLAKIWTDPAANLREEHYWPVTYTSFWIEWRLFGGSPVATHLINVAIHLLNGLLLWGLARGAGFRASGAISLLFLLHPIHVESVAWGVERKDVLSAFFYLAALAAWLSYLREPGWKKTAGIATFFTLAMLSKSIAATFPAAMVITAWMAAARRGGGIEIRRLRPVLLISALALAVVAIDLRLVSERATWSGDFSLAQRVQIGGRALWFYAGKLLWPANLMTIHPRWDPDGFGALAWVFPLTAIAAPLIPMAILRGRGRAACGFIALFIVTLLPVLCLLDFGYMKLSFVAERFQYLAGIALIVPVAEAEARLRLRFQPARTSRRRLATMASRAAAPTGALAILTFVYCSAYESNLTLFERNARLGPRSAGAAYNLASALHDAQLPPDRITAELLRTVEIDPDHAEAHNLLGVLFKRTGDPARALHHYRRAVETGGAFHEAHYNIGLLLREAGDTDGAISEYRKALELDPDFAMGWSNLGVALFESGKEEEGLDCIRRAARLVPQLVEAWENLGTIELKRGRYENAIAYFDEALRHRPEFARVIYGRGQAFEGLGRMPMAVAHYERAWFLDPTIHQAAARLGDWYAAQGEDGKAVGWFVEAARSRPDDAGLVCRVAEIQIRSGNPEQAEANLERLLRRLPDHVPALVLLARARLDSGDPDAAAEHLIAALEIAPDDVEAHVLLGRVLLDRREYSAAAGHLRRAVELRPDHPEAPALLRRALLRPDN